MWISKSNSLEWAATHSPQRMLRPIPARDLPPMRSSLLFGLLLSFASPALAADDYQLGPDSQRQEGVPQGTVTKHTFDTSKIFPGTTRAYWIYVPKQYD